MRRLFLGLLGALALTAAHATNLPAFVPRGFAQQGVTYDAFGDSITAGYAASATQYRYVWLIAAALSVTPNDHGISGTEAPDQVSIIYPTQVSPTASQLFTYMIGTNDGTFNGNSANSLATFQAVDQAELAWLAIPSTSKMVGQTPASIISVSSITSDGLGTATVTTSAPHGLTTGAGISIAGATLAAYNVKGPITVVDATHFTYAIAGTPTTPATTSGAITATSAGIIYAGTWSADGADYGGAFAEVSTTNASTATLSCYGIVCYLAYGMAVGDGGTFTISVDGVTYGSYTSSGVSGGLIATNQGVTHASGLARLSGLSQAAHTIIVTVTSATNAANHVWIDWVGQPSGSYQFGGPQVIAGGVPRNSTDGISTYQQLYTSLVKQNVGLLAADGLPVAYADVPGYINLTTDIINDGTHPNNLGMQHIANAFLAVINAASSGVTKSAAAAAANSSPITGQIISGPSASITNSGLGNAILGGGYGIGTPWLSISSAGADNTIVGGYNNKIANGGAVNTNNVIAGGANNSLQFGAYDFLGGGSNNLLEGNDATISGGDSNSAIGTTSWIPGGAQATDRGRKGAGCFGSGKINVQGDAQTCFFTLRQTTAGASAVGLTTDGNAPGGNNCINIPSAEMLFSLTIDIVAIDRTTPTKTITWNSWTGEIDRPTNAASTHVAMNATPTPLTNGTVTGNAIAASADTTNACLNLTFTPPTSNTDTWDIVAKVATAEAQ